ncbi:hypothetical protein F5I97DRAFT_2074469 [Phlebopus sp. FC_14]|nr:hypothetical protein F5I97DRAFT_2074469 [Phlebopus sp. FC_14]
MPNPQLIHTADPAYASPVIRAPSPASSVGTAYGPDETSLSDAELSQEEFERKCAAKLKLDAPKVEEEKKSHPILIDPPPNPAEEKVVFEAILRGLRNRVQQLEEEELFQKMLLRGSQAGLEQPSEEKLDALMRNLMEISTDNNDRHTSDGPWNRRHVEGSSATLTYEDTVVKGKQKV